ncbi:MAG: helicase C-terminal domain-containing protein [Thermosynechococcaceae cyanobacterium]
MIEVEVHQQLRALLRAQGGNTWPHHLTVARLTARALRLQRSTLIQVSSTAAYHGQHRLSYFASLLLWPGAAILVADPEVQQALCHIELPRLREGLPIAKPIGLGGPWPDPDFAGVLLLTPQDWLSRQLQQPDSFPNHVPLIIDGAENLDRWTRAYLVQSIAPQHWEMLMWAYPTHAHTIRDIRAALTHALFQHPSNPYGCLTLDTAKRSLLDQLLTTIQASGLTPYPDPWCSFATALAQHHSIAWATLDRDRGCFGLSCGPTDVTPTLRSLWQNRTVILVNGILDLDPQAELFRQQIGLDDLTCVQFATDRQNEALSLYLPDGLPMPNTPEFAGGLMTQLHRLLALRCSAEAFVVLLIDDLPLKTRVASMLAAEFGSRVKVERSDCGMGSILISGWAFWQSHQRGFPVPSLLAIATLPFPSLEDPKVAGRVAYYKQQRQDWFRLYLLPEALQILQQAIAPLRGQSGLLALLDNRVLHRSYGQQILSVLSPYARVSYLDESFLSAPQYSV